VCDFISLEDKCIISPEEELEVYERHENSIDDPRYVQFFMKFVNMAIIDHVERDEIECLDFGSGPEPVLAKLLRRQFDWQVDIYDKYYALEKIYKGNQYDLITSTEVAEHFDNPLRYFKLFKKLLRPDGLLSIMTLFHPSCDDFYNWFYINDPTHISFYSAKTLGVISEIVGLDILYCDDHRYVTFSHACPP
jgi:SAM-dependent methyltransferase